MDDRASRPCSSAATIRCQGRADGLAWPFSHRLTEAKEPPHELCELNLR